MSVYLCGVRQKPVFLFLEAKQMCSSASCVFQPVVLQQQQKKKNLCCSFAAVQTVQYVSASGDGHRTGAHRPETKSFMY